MNTVYDFVNKSVLSREIVQSTLNREIVKSTVTYVNSLSTCAYGMVPEIVKRQTASGLQYAQWAAQSAATVPSRISSLASQSVATVHSGITSTLYAVTPTFLTKKIASGKSLKMVANGNASNGFHSNGVANGHVINGIARGHAAAAVDEECLDKKLKPVRFQHPGSERDRIFVTGSFYQWQVQIPLTFKTSKFETHIYLPEGRHEFKFVVNGVWKHNANYPVVHNDVGDLNNYIDVQ